MLRQSNRVLQVFLDATVERPLSLSRSDEPLVARTLNEADGSRKKDEVLFLLKCALTGFDSIVLVQNR